MVRTIVVGVVIASLELVATPESLDAHDGSKAIAVSDAHRAAAIQFGRIFEKMRGDLMRIVVVVHVA